MIHICRENKVILVLNQTHKVIIYRLWRFLISVHHDMPAPPGPVFFQAVKRIETAGIHIPDTVWPGSHRNTAQTSLPRVGQSRGCGQAEPAPITTASALAKTSLSCSIGLEEVTVDLFVCVLKNIENHPPDGSRLSVQEIFHCRHGDLGGFLVWKVKFAGGDTTESDALEFVLRRQFQAGAIA